MLGVTAKFPKKRAFVTGAASGLGRAICLRLAKDGWKIALCDVNEARLKEAADEVQSLGGDAYPYVLDVTDRAQFKIVVEKFLEVGHGVDLVFNNAGVAGGGSFESFSLEDWDWLMGINFTAVVNGCHFFTPILREQRAGHVINTASAAALFPVPRMTAYCCAKAGVKVLSEVLYNEWKDYGIGVSVLMPEFFRTNLHENTRGENRDEAKALITKSKYSADDVALYALEAVAAGDLYITFPRIVRRLWWIKRINPMLLNYLLRARTDARVKKRIGA